MPAWAAGRADRSKGSQQPLRMASRRAALQHAFPLARWLGRVRSAVGHSAALALVPAGHHRARGGARAGACGGDQPAWHIHAACAERAQDLLGGLLLPPVLDQHSAHVPILINRAPPGVPWRGDLAADRVAVPRGSRSGTPTSPLMGIRLAKRQPPLAHRCVGYDAATCGQQRCPIPRAEGEAEGAPPGVGHACLGEAKPVGGRRCTGCLHAKRMTHASGAPVERSQVDSAPSSVAATSPYQE